MVVRLPGRSPLLRGIGGVLVDADLVGADDRGIDARKPVQIAIRVRAGLQSDEGAVSGAIAGPMGEPVNTVCQETFVRQVTPGEVVAVFERHRVDHPR